MLKSDNCDITGCQVVCDEDQTNYPGFGGFALIWPNEGGFRGQVPTGPHIALEIRYDHPKSQATFLYDNNINDDVAPISFGPIRYNGTFMEEHRSSLFMASYAAGEMRATVDYWSFTSPDAPLIGDFNQDGLLDVLDIDELTRKARAGTHEAAFDLNADQLVDELDRSVWVRELRKTYFGDSNLDGQFNTNDLVLVFQTAQYEDPVADNSTWATGDWSGDGEFTSRDLVLAFQDGGFEQGPRPASSVPEPASLICPLLASLVAIRHFCAAIK